MRLLHSLGYTTGIDLAQLAQTGNWISEMLSIRNESNVGRALVLSKSAATFDGDKAHTRSHR